MTTVDYNYTLSVTFPRCGYNVVHNVLCMYMAEIREFDGLKLCLPLEGRAKERSEKEQLRLVFDNEAPSKIPNIALQKTHDFVTDKKLDIIKDTATQYLLIFRNPLSSMASNYMLYKKNNEHKPDKKIASWHRYVKEQIEKWNKFMEKWYLDDSIKTLKIFYDDFVDDPLKNMSSIINYIFPSHEITVDLLEKSIKKLNIGIKHTVKDYSFYDEEEFRQFEEKTVWKDIIQS